MSFNITTDGTLFELNNVSLVYRALPALQSIQWQLRQGEQWACLGPNGAGKTSLARILSAQATHYSGDFVASAAMLEQGVAFVCFEQAQALCARDKKLDDSEFRPDAADPGTTVRSALLGNSASTRELTDWTQRLQMEHVLDRGLRYISTGEMRKALLVKALLAQPALLILDSPLDGLDLESQTQMKSIIDELLASEINVLLLCRALEDVPAGISHVLVLNNGETIAAGTRKTVMNDPAVLSLMNPSVPALESLPEPEPRPYALPATGPYIEMRGVNVSYGDLQVLRDIDWTYDRGDHCLLAGPNGCGKTTLLSLITGDNHKAYGQNITLFGVLRGSGESVWDIKQKYGQLDTQLHLNFARNMKVIEAVVSGFFDTIGLYDDWGDLQRERAEQWLCALGLGQYMRDSFDGLSFGLQRMVLLARAMVKSPAVLILDEPTLGLDGHHRKLLLRAIDHIASNSDTQIIFVSHSAGDTPNCINQRLTFEPRNEGFALVTRR